MSAQDMTWSQVCRRAGGRRHYNSVRQWLAGLRQREVAHLLRQYGMERGVQAKIARELGVSEATISRDVAALRRQGRETRQCPLCGHRLLPDRRS